MQANQNSTTRVAGRRSSALAQSASLIALTLAIGGLAGVNPVSAQSNWTGAVSTDWFNPDNWIAGVPGVVPFSYAMIDAPTRQPIVDGLAEANFVYIGTFGDGALTIINGGALWASYVEVGAGSGAHSAITVAGPGSILGSSNLLLGYSGAGVLIVSDGGAVDSGSATIALDAGSVSSATVTGPGSAWQVTDTLLVGNAGGGTLTIEAGGSVSSALSWIAYSPGSDGQVTVTGPGSRWVTGPDVMVGVEGAATLIVSDEGAVESENATIAAYVGSTASATVQWAGSSWTVAGALVVGDGGDGTLAIEAGGAVSSDWAYLGFSGEGLGTVTGANSVWSNAGTLTLGYWGSGELVVEDGAAVSSGPVEIGVTPGAEGAMTVTGAGSALTVNGDLYIGMQGDGAVIVADGAQLSMTDSVYLSFGPGYGELTVTGAGSTVYSGSPFQVGGGDGATSVVTVSDGGRIYAPGSTIASSADTHAAVTVTGAGSALILDDELTIGSEGHGELTISDGALVQADDVLMGTYFGSSGVLTLESGGVLATDWIDRTGGDASIVFDGGILRVTGYASSLLAGFEDGDVILAEGGGTIDTQDNIVSTYVGFQGDGGLTKIGGGLLFLDGVNTYAGDTRIVAGRIETWAADALSAASTHDISAGAALGLVIYTQTIGGLAGAGSLQLGSSTGLTTGANDASTTFAGVIAGDGWLVKTGTGTLTLTGANTWSGGARLDAGALTLGSSAALGASSLTLAGGVLGYADGVTIANSVVLDSATARFEVLTGSAVQSGGISQLNGPRAFEKTGDGELVLTGANSWTGLTTVSQGTLVIEGVNSQGTGPYHVGRSYGDDGALVIREGGSVANGQSVIGFNVGSTGAATVTGTDSLWTSGELYVGAGGDGTLTVQAGGKLTATGSYLGNYAGSTGAVSVTGTASLWSNSGGLYVGVTGDGSLTIAEGGTVRVGGGAGLAYVAYHTGSGALNIGAAAGDAAVAAGTLEASEVQFGAGAGSLTFNHTGTAYDFDADIAGAGAIQVLAGLTTLTGDSSAFTGATSVTGGALRVAGTLGGDLTVTSGSLGGGGSVLGAVSVGAGTLIGETGSVLTLGSLSLASTSVLDLALGAPGAGTLFDVTGDLTLDGTLDITDAGRFGAGVYGLIRYGGILTDHGLTFGDLPVGYTPGDLPVAYASGDLALQTSVTGQVNLVSAGIADLLFWDGGDPLNADNDLIDGGDGTWTLTSATWTDVDGLVAGAMTPLPGLAVFMGGGGTVTLDDSAGALSVTGLQFAADGYVLTGDALTLVEESPDFGVNLRVGDGTAAGAGWTTIIESDLISTADLYKTDYGTLGLAGDSVFGDVHARGGQLAVTGTLSGGDLYVGMSGAPGDTAAMTISDGGAVSNAAGWIGFDAGSAGAVTVSGAGSSWTHTGALTVGYRGSAALHIANGGQVSSVTSYVAVGSASAVTITGPGSTWANSNLLYLGYSAAGTLQIADGGVVRVGAGTGVVHFGYSPMGVGNLIIGGAADGPAAAPGLVEAAELHFGPYEDPAGVVVFNHTRSSYDFDPFLAGAGRIEVLAGGTTLTGDSSAFTGDTIVAGGDLRIANVLGGDVTLTGGSLGGGGAVLGAVSTGAGSLVGEAGSVLTMGSLSLASTTVLDVTLGAPGAGALFDVTGDLTLDGTLDITDAGGFGAGVYGLISYGGILTDNGLTFGDLPVGYVSGYLAVQTSVAGQVNLVNAGIADLLFWDGGDPLNADNDLIDGGDGTWTLTSATWTDVDGLVAGAMTPLPGLAVFMGGGGTVTLDDSAGALSVTGVQFAADGYVLTGDALTLVEESLDFGVNLRVGDGTAAGAGWTTIIESDLISTADLYKTDYGILVLAGDNAFGNIDVRGGQLAVTGALSGGGHLNVASAGAPGDVAALTISGGGAVSNTSADLGSQNGSSGEVTVIGAGSTWTNSDGLTVGRYGDGTLTIADGGAVSNAGVVLGREAGSTGEVSVTSAGSTWANDGELFVGMSGDGTLTIADGGEVSNMEAYVGLNAGGGGDVTVTGAGSAWVNSGAFIGYMGSGRLTIADGGAVSNADGWIGSQAGSPRAS